MLWNYIIIYLFIYLFLLHLIFSRCCCACRMCVCMVSSSTMHVCVCRAGMCISVARVGVWQRISQAQGLLLHFHDYYCCPLPYGVVGVQVGWAGGGLAVAVVGVQATVSRYMHALIHSNALRLTPLNLPPAPTGAPPTHPHTSPPPPRTHTLREHMAGKALHTPTHTRSYKVLNKTIHLYIYTSYKAMHVETCTTC